MVFAQIKDGTVQNTIVLDDLNLMNHFLQGFDYLIRVDNLPENSQPSIGWNYDGHSFSEPTY